MAAPHPPVAPKPLPIYCSRCGYNLTGLTLPRCPECGTPFDATTVSTSPAGPLRWRSSVTMLLGAPLFIGLALTALIWIEEKASGGVHEAWVAFVLVVAAAAAVCTSIIVGRRLARRLARKAPSDPPSPATVSMTLAFGGLFFLAQCCIGFAVFFVGCTVTLMALM